MKNIFLLFLLVIIVVLSTSSCISEHERNGYSNAPFNTPEDNTRRTFDGDW